MKAFPLKSMTIEEATIKQFELVDAITKHFNGLSFLSMGDLGVTSQLNQPLQTRKVEQVLASFFQSEDAVLIRGAGTTAIKEMLSTVVKSGDAVLVHTSPIYETTHVSLKQLGVVPVAVDFHEPEKMIETIQTNNQIKAILIQYSRQALSDHYDMAQLVAYLRQHTQLPIVTDDNYVVMKVDQIGVQCGAHASAFSLFKLLGPPGIGCVVGNQKIIEQIRGMHYSGGSQVQGYEAMDALRSLVYAPVSLAIQATIVDEVAKKLNDKTIEGVKEAYVVNAQSKVVIVCLEKPIASDVIKVAEKLGATPHPVGAESRFEVPPMFYRVSKTMCEDKPDAMPYLIRINPMRSGTKTVLRILKQAIEEVDPCF